MEYKTKGKGVSDGKGERKRTKPEKVNKKQENEERKKETADDVSKTFPSFSVLTKEEKLAFFEALSAARKSIEKRGLHTRERFGTVHDQYLEYFHQDDKHNKEDAVHPKPDSAPSSRPNRSPTVTRKTSKQSSPRTQQPTREKTPQKTPKPLSPKTATPAKLTHKISPRPESAPIDKCEEIIKRDTDKVIQMYLDKKKRIEEKWKKSSPPKPTPPPRTKTTTTTTTRTQKTTKPTDKEPVPPTTTRQKPPRPTKAGHPQFRALNPVERKEFFRILKEARDNVVVSNPHKKNRILPLEEVLRPYKSGKVTTMAAACTVGKDGEKRKDQHGNLRVKVTLTSGDNERLNRTKSTEIICETEKQGPGERSKSLESMQTADKAHEKHSKIPILRKAPHEKRNDADKEGKKLKKAERGCGPAPAPATAAEECTTKKTPATKEKEKTPEVNKAEDEEEMKKRVLEKIKQLEEVVEECEKKTVSADEEAKVTATTKNSDRSLKRCDESGRGSSQGSFSQKKMRALKQEKKKAEMRRSQHKKEKMNAVAWKKEKENLKKKKRDERKRKLQKKDSKEKKSERKNKKKKAVCDSLDSILVCKKISREHSSTEVKFEVPKEPKEEKEEHLAKEKCPDEVEQEKERVCSGQSEKEEERKESVESHSCSEEFSGSVSEEASCESLACAQKEEEEEEEEDEEEEDDDDDESECSKTAEVECPKTAEVECSKATEVESPKTTEVECPKTAEVECRRTTEVECPKVTEVECPKATEVECPKVTEVECPRTTEVECRRTTEVECVGDNMESELMLKPSRNKIAGVSLVEERPGELWEAQEWVPTFTTGKVIVVDDNVIRRIKTLIYNLDLRVNPRENLESEYLKLVLGYSEYLTKMAEYIVRRKMKQGYQQVHSTYAAHEVHLKFHDKTRTNDPQKHLLPRSISASDLLKQLPGPSGVEKKPKALPEKDKRNRSDVEEYITSDSDSSLNSLDNYASMAAASFKKPGISVTKIRLLQDLLKGRAIFEEGSTNDLRIIRCPEVEHVLPEKTVFEEETKEPSEMESEPAEKAVLMKFLRNLAKLCNCGRKQVEEDALMENLKGEAVKVETFEKKGPASATINPSTMDVLKAAERKKIIEKYMKKNKS